ncbi:MAG: hypothetical protein F9K41_00180, partial [Sphingopyxis terrae]
MDQRRGIDDRGLRHNRGRGAIDPEQIGGGPSGQPLPGNRLDLRHRREVDLMDVTVMSAGGPAAGRDFGHPTGAPQADGCQQPRRAVAHHQRGAHRSAAPGRYTEPSARHGATLGEHEEDDAIPGAAAQQRVLRDAAKQPTCRARFARRHQHVAREKHVTWKQHIAGKKHIAWEEHVAREQHIPRKGLRAGSELETVRRE